MSKAEGEPEGSRFSMARLRGGFHAWQERREKERIKRDAETYELLNSGRSFDPEIVSDALAMQLHQAPGQTKVWP